MSMELFGIMFPFQIVLVFQACTPSCQRSLLAVDWNATIASLAVSPRLVWLRFASEFPYSLPRWPSFLKFTIHKEVTRIFHMIYIEIHKQYNYIHKKNTIISTQTCCISSKTYSAQLETNLRALFKTNFNHT